MGRGGRVIGRVLAQEIGHQVFTHNLVTLQPCDLQNVTSLSFRFFCYNTEKDLPDLCHRYCPCTRLKLLMNALNKNVVSFLADVAQLVGRTPNGVRAHT